MRTVGPRSLFRLAARAEAVTWALLLLGMFLKYGTGTTALGVSVFGMAHGVVFIAYCLVAVLVAVDQRWALRRTLVALASAVPPFATLGFEAWVGRRGPVADAWRLRADEPSGPLERPAALLLRRPARGAVLGAALVAVITAAALAVGPPA